MGTSLTTQKPASLRIHYRLLRGLAVTIASLMAVACGTSTDTDEAFAYTYDSYFRSFAIEYNPAVTVEDLAERSTIVVEATLIDIENGRFFGASETEPEGVTLNLEFETDDKTRYFVQVPRPMDSDVEQLRSILPIGSQSVIYLQPNNDPLEGVWHNTRADGNEWYFTTPQGWILDHPERGIVFPLVDNESEPPFPEVPADISDDLSNWLVGEDAVDPTAPPIPSPAQSVPADAIEEEAATPPAPAAESDVPEFAPAGTPEAISTGPALTWTAFDPDEALGPDWDELIRLESVGDGRVLLSTLRPGDNRVMVTKNGVDWAEVSMPSDSFLPRHIDVGGSRWLVSGLVLDSAEPVEVPAVQVFFSDDRGASWTELDFSADAPDGVSGSVAAMAAGERMVVAAWFPAPPDAAEPQDQPFRPPNVVLLRLGVFFSDGGPAELVAEYPSWDATGYGASDGFYLTLFGDERSIRLFSPDGRQWSESPVEVGDFEGTAFSTGDSGVIWTTDPSYGPLRVERFPGVFGPAPVATLPGGISWISGLSVGPAGVAAVAQPGTPIGPLTFPELRIEKDGYELRYNEPEGGITLWDLSQDAAVYVFDLDDFDEENPLPEGVRQVEVGDNGDNFDDLIVFLDPDTGDDLVAFSREELFLWIMSAFGDPATDLAARLERPGPVVGWSADGTNWAWQTFPDAFGLTGLTAEENAFTSVNVAVGGDFVIAQVVTYRASDIRTYGPDGSDALPGEDGRSTSTSSSPQPPRWFIARVR